MIKQSELLFFNAKKKQLDKTYFLLAGMVAEMESNDPRRFVARKLLSEYAAEARS